MIKRMLVIVAVLLLSACGAMMSNNGANKTVSSSLVDFLYPNPESRSEHKSEVPTLILPVNVGIAFIPSNSLSRDGISHNSQMALLEKVKASFIKYDYIDRIELIPSTYLKGGQGFDTLAQVARLHDVDVMALISYDQVSQTLDNNAALLYWTIVGMYVIPGNENSVQTFVDTAVFDVKSKKMLFRAPGLSKLEERSTAIGIDATLDENGYLGFDLAVDDMVTNLDDELGRFKVRVKEEKVAKIEHKEGYSGGALGGWLLTLLLAVGLGKRKLKEPQLTSLS
ncbi:rhombotarget lipoprotein [Shewanella colwelliana]|uniref:Rhombotarget lipoprotein n=1 Tax=Shewanella colwelliana TaxID=23 RepID=A0ABQ4PC27_SHECO|nr:rhombotarget lipoprotein [Shewanella colwelliana]GIU45117.1 rhombotarget lipoprotein [Shewanella colwelliana]